MKKAEIMFYFPLERCILTPTLESASIAVAKLNLLPQDTFVWENKEKMVIGRTTQKYDPAENLTELIGCNIIQKEGSLIDPTRHPWGHFKLMSIIPLLDHEIKVLMTEISNDIRYQLQKDT